MMKHAGVESLARDAIEAGGELLVPKLTDADISASIHRRQFHHFPGTNMTVCALTLGNGFVVIGYSACASADTFDGEEGRKLAFDNAREKVWELEGYRLRQQLHERGAR